MGSNKQKIYDDEFKASAVKMVIEKGRAISEVSKSLDVSEPVLRRWVTAAKEPGDRENSRVKELEAELKKIKKEKINRHFCVDTEKVLIFEKYECIQAYKSECSVEKMCGILKVSRSGYYSYLSRPESNRFKRKKRILNILEESHNKGPMA